MDFVLGKSVTRIEGPIFFFFVYSQSGWADASENHQRKGHFWLLANNSHRREFLSVFFEGNLLLFASWLAQTTDRHLGSVLVLHVARGPRRRHRWTW